MPLGPKATQIRRKLHAKHGRQKGDRIFFASVNKGTIREDHARPPGLVYVDAASVGLRLIDLKGGHHVAGTPYRFHHGWVPISGMQSAIDKDPELRRRFGSGVAAGFAEGHDIAARHALATHLMNWRRANPGAKVTPRVKANMMALSHADVAAGRIPVPAHPPTGDEAKERKRFLAAEAKGLDPFLQPGHARQRKAAEKPDSASFAEKDPSAFEAQQDRATAIRKELANLTDTQRRAQEAADLERLMPHRPPPPVDPEQEHAEAVAFFRKQVTKLNQAWARQHAEEVRAEAKKRADEHQAAAEKAFAGRAAAKRRGVGKAGKAAGLHMSPAMDEVLGERLRQRQALEEHMLKEHGFVGGRLHANAVKLAGMHELDHARGMKTRRAGSAHAHDHRPKDGIPRASALKQRGGIDPTAIRRRIEGEGKAEAPGLSEIKAAARAYEGSRLAPVDLTAALQPIPARIVDFDSGSVSVTGTGDGPTVTRTVAGSGRHSTRTKRVRGTKKDRCPLCQPKTGQVPSKAAPIKVKRQAFGLANDDTVRVLGLDLAADSMAKATTPRLLGTHPLWFKPGFKLPDYIEHVASHFIGSHGKSRGIAMAIGIIKNWAHGHPSGGEKRIHPDTVAAARLALSQWEALKARAKSVKSNFKLARPDAAVVDLRGSGRFRHGWIPITEGTDMAAHLAAHHGLKRSGRRSVLDELHGSLHARHGSSSHHHGTTGRSIRTRSRMGIPAGAALAASLDDVSYMIDLVGPKGYVHGWIKVGAGGDDKAARRERALRRASASAVEPAPGTRSPGRSQMRSTAAIPGDEHAPRPARRRPGRPQKAFTVTKADGRKARFSAAEADILFRGAEPLPPRSSRPRSRAEAERGQATMTGGKKSPGFRRAPSKALQSKLEQQRRISGDWATDTMPNPVNITHALNAAAGVRPPDSDSYLHFTQEVPDVLDLANAGTYLHQHLRSGHGASVRGDRGHDFLSKLHRGLHARLGASHSHGPGQGGSQGRIVHRPVPHRDEGTKAPSSTGIGVGTGYAGGRGQRRTPSVPRAGSSGRGGKAGIMMAAPGSGSALDLADADGDDDSSMAMHVRKKHGMKVPDGTSPAACARMHSALHKRGIRAGHSPSSTDYAADSGSYLDLARTGLDLAVLKAAGRKSLPDSAFGLPDQRKYPMKKPDGSPDKGHAANAKARAAQMLKRGRINKAQHDKIVAKANRTLGSS